MKRNSPEYRAEQTAFWCKLHAVRVEHYLRIGEHLKAEQFAYRLYSNLVFMGKISETQVRHGIYTFRDVLAAIRAHGAANFIKYHFAQ